MEIRNSLSVGCLLRGHSHSYRIEKILGSGGFGITYLASLVINDRVDISVTKVAVKEFFMSEINGRHGYQVTSAVGKNGMFSKYLEKFIKEADKLSQMDMSHIVKVLECFRANGTAYYVMQYLTGGSLEDLIVSNGILREDEVVNIAVQIAEALQYMHSRGMLHLDLKPANVMFDGKGNVVLIDFGMSKQYDEVGNPESSTTIGGGTPGYAPIEQLHFHDGREFPVTMDIYAFGATFYKMLVGVRPPEASTILNNGFPSADLQNVSASPGMINFLEKLMNPLKRLRPQDFQSVLEELWSMSSSCFQDRNDNSTVLMAKFSNPEKSDYTRRTGFDFEKTVLSNDLTISKSECRSSDQNIEENYKDSKRSLHFDDKIDFIEIKQLGPIESAEKMNFITIGVSPHKLTVVQAHPEDDYPQKHTFFYSPVKFKELLLKLNQCGLSVIRLGKHVKSNDGEVSLAFGRIEIRTYRNGGLLCCMSSYRHEGYEFIVGDINKLIYITFREIGFSKLMALSRCGTWKGKLVRFVITPRNYIQCLILGCIIFLWHNLVKPWQIFGIPESTWCKRISLCFFIIVGCIAFHYLKKYLKNGWNRAVISLFRKIGI